MTRSVVPALSLALFVLAAGCLGGGWPGSDTRPSETTVPAPTTTAVTAGSDTAGPGTGTPTVTGTATAAFAFVSDTVENCGTNCRDLTGTIKNTGTAPATDARIRLYIAAEQTTILNTTERVGRVAAGESITLSKRVRVGISEYLAIRGNDGQIRIELTVIWDGGTWTTTERRDVL